MHPVFRAEQAVVPLPCMMQSHTPSMHLDDGSAARHCRSVTQGRPRLIASLDVSNRLRIPVVNGEAGEQKLQLNMY